MIEHFFNDIDFVLVPFLELLDDELDVLFVQWPVWISGLHYAAVDDSGVFLRQIANV